MSADQAKDDKQKIWDALEAADASGVPMPKDAEASAPAPAADAPADSTAAPAAAEAAAAAPPAADDPYAGLPAVLKDEILGMKAMLQQQSTQLRSANGHIGGLTSQLKDLRAAQASVKASGDDAPTAEQLRKAQGDASKMARLKEDYPEFGAALDDALEERLKSVTEGLKSPAVDGEQKVFTRAEFNDFRVETAHPGWKEKVVAPEFSGWLQAQPREVQALGASANPQDAIRLLDLHKQARTTTPQDEINTQRLAAAAAIPTGRASSGVRTKPLDAMTKAELWAYYDEQDRVAAKA